MAHARFIRFHPLVRAFCAAAMLPAASIAGAAEHCVDSVPELRAALNAATESSEDDLIKVERGQYVIDSPVSYGRIDADQIPLPPLLPSGALVLRGGYDDGCGGRIVNPLNTIMTGQGSTFAAFTFHARGDDLEIDAVSFDAMNSVRIDTPDCSGESVSGIVLKRMRVAGSVVPFAENAEPALFIRSRCADVRVENALVVASNGHGLRTHIDPGWRFDLVHSTIADNAGDGLNLLQFAAAPVQLTNSILWGNGGNDIRHTQALVAEHATWGTRTGGGTVSGSGNLAVDPQLNATFRPVEPASPSIDSGTTIVPGGAPITDIAGAQRTRGGLPDRGAYESGVDAAGTVTVTNTADSGSGSLRAAITSANALPGRQNIVFNIEGACPQVIALNSLLPDLAAGVDIDGYTQPGAQENTAVFGFNGAPCIVLTPATALGRGLRIATSGNDPVLVRGLAFSNWDDFSGAALSAVSGNGHRIEGNQFAGSVAGLPLLANHDNIRIGEGVVVGAINGLTIGGSDVAQKNFISGANDDGVDIRGGALGVIVTRNVIGASANGNSALPNAVGIHVQQSPSNLISNNQVAGNDSHGVWIHGASADNNELRNNSIGLKAFAFCLPPCTPQPQLPNGGHGVLVNRALGDAMFTAPSATRITGNTIAYSGGDGVSLHHGLGHQVSGSIHNNGGLAIDLGGDGPDANDDDSAGDAGLRPNRGLNAPDQLVAQQIAAGSSVVLGRLLSSAADYTIDVYASPTCDASGRGEGQLLIASTTLSIVGDGQPTAFWEVTIPPDQNLSGRFVTATARDQYWNTSEFSECVAYQQLLLFRDSFE